MDIIASKTDNLLKKEIEREKEEYENSKSSTYFSDLDKDLEVENLLQFKEFPIFNELYNQIEKNDKLNKLLYDNNSIQGYGSKLLSYDESFRNLEKLELLEKSKEYKIELIKNFTYQEYRKIFNIYYIFLQNFYKFKSLIDDFSYYDKIKDLFESYLNQFFAGALGEKNEENETNIFNYSSILRNKDKIKSIYIEAVEQVKLINNHIIEVFKYLDKLYNSFKEISNLSLNESYYLGIMVGNRFDNSLYLNYHEFKIPIKENQILHNILQFNKTLPNIKKSLQQGFLNNKLLPLGRNINKNNYLTNISVLQKTIGLTDNDLDTIIEFFKESIDSLKQLEQYLINEIDILKYIKQKNISITSDLLKDLNLNKFELYAKYGKPFEDLYLKDKKSFDIKKLIESKKANFNNINKIIPNLGTQLVKWLMTNSADAWLFYDTFIKYKSFLILCGLYPKLDINVCKREYRKLLEILNDISKLESNDYENEELIYILSENFKINNLNQLHNLLKKYLVIIRAMHNNRFNYNKYNQSMILSFLKSTWDPDSDIISKFLDLIFNEKLSNIFNKQEYQNPNNNRGQTEESIKLQKDAIKLKINLDDVRQKLIKYKMKFFAGEPISVSEKTEVYDLSEKINLLFSYSYIEEYSSQIENKVPELYKLNCQIDGFEFKVLPQGSYQHFQVGAATNCCQSIGGAGEDAVIDSYINSEAGVLVLSKDGQLIAQSYFHYVPKDNGYILDNVEVNEGNLEKYKVNINEIYAKLAQYIKSRFKIKYFKCGKEYNSLDNNRFKTVKMKNDPRKFSVDEPYTDFDEDDHIDLLSPI